jgi:hypothetical protein
MIGALGELLLLGGAAAAKRVLLDLVGDDGGRVGEENGRVGVAGAHFGVMALERGEEFRVNERGLEQLEARRDVARDAKVGILVDGARNEARHVGAAAKDVRKGARERGRGLNGGKGPLADIALIVKAEGGGGRVRGDEALNLNDERIHVTHVLQSWRK